MMKKIFFKLLLAALPLVVITSVYIYVDPFLVIRHDYNLSAPDRKHLELNEDYLATEKFIKDYDSAQFDSYVFGSSRVGLYRGAHLEQMFESKKCLNYSVAEESLFGVERKLEFLNAKKVKIANVLIGIDEQLLSTVGNSRGHLFRKHPLLSGETNIEFQSANYLDIFDIGFMKAYYKLLTTNQPVKSDIKGDIYARMEEAIVSNSDSFYNVRKSVFFERKSVQEFGFQVVGNEQKRLLKNIKNIFDKQHTHYYIVIHPLYDQKKLNEKDLTSLYEIFGKEHIYDFSGINSTTSNKHNYYESDHYRKHIAEGIMDSLAKVH